MGVRTCAALMVGLFAGGCFGQGSEPRRHDTAEDLASVPAADLVEPGAAPHDMAKPKQPKPDLASAPNNPALDMATSPDLSGPNIPDMADPEIRPLPTSVAYLRLADLTQSAPPISTKLCVFGDDADPRPYAILSSPAHDGSWAEPSYELPAQYAAVPAGIPLRIHVIGETPQFPTACSRPLAHTLSSFVGMGKDALAAKQSYTLVKTWDRFVKCVKTALDNCEFAPPTEGDTSGLWCPTTALLLFTDGFASGASYQAGYRIVNLTGNASVVSAAFPPSNQRSVLHHGTLATPSYELPSSSDAIAVCAEFIDDCGLVLSPTLALLDCSQGGATWSLGQLTSSRLTNKKQMTTIYLIGTAKHMNAAKTELLGPALQFVIAHDVVETLP